MVAYDRKHLMELMKLAAKNAKEDQADEVRIALGALAMVCFFSFLKS